jgi:nucleotide-binding universal stress UspA family protein
VTLPHGGASVHGMTSLVAESPPLQVAAGRAVVVGYDGSPSARRALTRAAGAAGDGGCVVIVTASPPEGGYDAEPDLGALPALLAEEAAELLQGAPVRVSTRAVAAEPAIALLEVAREVRASVIVIGRRGHSFLERARRGPVAERLAARAPCDLLVVQ